MTLIALCISAVQSERPAYPSSKSRAKDWDKLEAEVKKEVLQIICAFGNYSIHSFLIVIIW
jgi:hypothetical protein